MHVNNYNMRGEVIIYAIECGGLIPISIDYVMCIYNNLFL